MTNFTYLPGDTFQLVVTWASDGTPIDLTDYTASFKVAIPGEDDFEITEGDGITITAVDGQVAVDIDSETTAEWDGDLHYRLRVTSPTGVVTTLVFGSLAVQDAIA